jgi:hypothetical protein
MILSDIYGAWSGTVAYTGETAAGAAGFPVTGNGAGITNSAVGTISIRV